MKKIWNCAGVFLLAGLLLVVGFVSYLEIGSQRYTRDMPVRARGPIAVCDTARYAVDPDKQAAIDHLVEKRRAGEPITRTDLDRAMIVIKQEEMRGINGVYCSELIFVSSRLPGPARYYVARHELEHAFQHFGAADPCQDDELCANWIAGREYPLGLLQTITSSLAAATKLYPSFQEFLFGSWAIFKFYFLPGGG